MGSEMEQVNPEYDSTCTHRMLLSIVDTRSFYRMVVFLQSGQARFILGLRRRAGLSLAPACLMTLI